MSHTFTYNMNVAITRNDLEKRLEKRVVCDVLNDIHTTAQRWNRGGALIHRVRAAGYMAESGARNIADGRTPISETTTFEQMRVIAKKMYDDTIDFLYPIVKSGIYAT